MTVEHFDFALAWDWEYDAPFVACLENQVHAHRMRFFSISHHNVHETLKRLQRGALSFGAFLDRASDADENFVPLAKHLKKSPTLFLNHPDHVHLAADKATMHLELVARNIQVPFTIIISPYNKKKDVELSLGELSRLGRPFIIKPANTTGGGIGVILGAETLKDVIESRQHHKNDQYLLQEKITPVRFHSRKGWFRAFYICGTILPCWWDTDSHVYQMITRTEVKDLGLRQLVSLPRRIWEVCKLEFFSTEIAITAEKKFVVVDYVNEICDMRLQSRHPDGVPDLVVTEVCRRLARYLRTAAARPPA